MASVATPLLSATAFAYLLLLLAAAGWDLARMIIPNALVVTMLVLFPVAALAAPASAVVWWSHLAAGAGVFVVGLAAYRFRVMGAGDVKLLAAIAVWAGLSYLPMVLLVTVLSGGALAILMMVVRRLAMAAVVAFSGREAVTMPRVLLSGEKLPYGVAIALGGATLLFGHPFFQGVI